MEQNVEEGKKNGANERNRTADLFITSELLYRLSYIGTVLCHNTHYYITHAGKRQANIEKKLNFFSF